MTSQYQNNIILYFLAFPPLKKICEKFGQLPGKHCMFHALPQGLNLFLMETHTSNTNPQDVHAIPKIQITKETTFKNTK